MPDSPLFLRRILTTALLVSVPTFCGSAALAAGEACELASVTFRLDATPAYLYSLQFEVGYSATGGHFVEHLGAMDCEFLQDGASGGPTASVLENDPDTQTVTFGQNDPDAYDLWRCHFATSGVLPAASDFSITVTEARSYPNGEPASATVSISDLSCGAACPDEVQSGCLEAGNSRLRMQLYPERLEWKWLKGAPLAIAQISDPTTAGHYGLCLYKYVDDFASFYWERRFEVRLPLATGWESNGAHGYRYEAVGDAVRRLQIKTSETGQTRIKLQGRLTGIGDPYDMVPANGYVVQLIDPLTGTCWESRYRGYELDDLRFDGRTGY